MPHIPTYSSPAPPAPALAASPGAPGSPMSWGFLLAIYVALMVLLAGTVVAAHFPLGAAALLVALGIAGTKALLVILYFMHVRFSSRETWLFVGAGFLWLSIMFSLTFAEYIGRTSLNRLQPLPSMSAPQ